MSRTGRTSTAATLIGALVLLIGGGIAIALSAEALRGGAPASRWLAGLIAGIGCVTAGATLAGVIGTSVRQSIEAAKRRHAHPDRPWMWRADWAEGVALDQIASRSLVRFLAAVSWNVTALPVLYALRQELVKSEVRLATALILPLVGVFLLLIAAYEILRRQRYGVPRCVFDHVPIAPGAELRGAIEARLPERAEGGVRLALSCVRMTNQGTGRDETRIESVLLRHEVVVPPESQIAAPDGMRVPFSIPVPDGLAAGDPEGSPDATRWVLEAAASTPGVDLAARFDVPIFRAEDTRSDTSPATALAVDQTDEGRERITIRGRARVGVVIGFLVFGGVCALLVSAAIRAEAPAIVPVAFGALGFLIALSIVDELVGRDVILFRPSTVLIRREWPGVPGRERLIDSADIHRVHITTRSTATGGIASHSVAIELKNGRTVVAASGLRRREAAQLAARLQDSRGGRGGVRPGDSPAEARS